jgi:hypothetical protein
LEEILRHAISSPISVPLSRRAWRCRGTDGAPIGLALPSDRGGVRWIAAAKNDPCKQAASSSSRGSRDEPEGGPLRHLGPRTLARDSRPTGPVFRTFDLRGRLTENRLDPGDLAHILRRRATAAHPDVAEQGRAEVDTALRKAVGTELRAF